MPVVRGCLIFLAISQIISHLSLALLPHLGLSVLQNDFLFQ